MDERVTGYIASLPSPQREICRALRELILRNLTVSEQFKVLDLLRQSIKVLENRG